MPKNKKQSVTLVDQYDGESPAGTEFRRLLHNLLTSPSLPEDGKTFLITSATLGEGKSTIASNLGVTASIFKSKKTLLIDADLRRPTLHNLFQVGRANGLTDVLDGDIKLKDATQPTQLDYLWLLTAGRPHKDPTRYFESGGLHETIEAARFYFDVIIIDCAPVIPVSDTLSLGMEIDGLLMVVKAGDTPKEVVKRACDLVRESGANLLGVAMNNVKQALPYYYNQNYYGYKYISSQK